MSVKTISALELQTLRLLRGIKLIDVREPAEYQAGHIPGAKLLPLSTLTPATLVATVGEQIDGRKDELYVTCQSGIRSADAAARLAELGYRNVTVLTGGLNEWQSDRLPIRRCGPPMTLQRQVQLVLGVMIIAFIALGYLVHPGFSIAAALLGAGLISAGLTNWCGLAQLVARMPWNQPRPCTQGVGA